MTSFTLSLLPVGVASYHRGLARGPARGGNWWFPFIPAMNANRGNPA